MNTDEIKPLVTERPSPAVAEFMQWLLDGIAGKVGAESPGNRAGKTRCILDAEFTETARPKRAGGLVRLAHIARKWHVEFQVIRNGAPVTEALEIEARDPITRKEAEAVVRKAVKQTIARFTMSEPTNPKTQQTDL